jgi:spore germination protein YaaH
MGYHLISCDFFKKIHILDRIEIMTNKYYKIQYPDAAYSYMKDVLALDKKVTSCGVIKTETDTYIDLEIAWTENPHQTVFSVVIPKKNSSTKPAPKYLTGDIVAIYWNDVFLYNEDYKGKCLPTPMLTEGEISEETSRHIILKNPETLNMKDMCNHPEQKPEFYFIPKTLITEIKLVKKNEA